MNKDEKERVVTELTERLKNTDTLIVADYRGLTMPQIDDLRGKLLEHGARFTVVKNTLTRRAAEEAGADALLALLEGPSAIAFIESDGDMVAVAKALADSAKSTNVLEIRGGLMQGRTISAGDVDELAKLPPFDVLRGQVLGAIVAPLQNLLGLVNAPLQNLVGLIDARIEQLGNQPGADSPEAAVEPVGVAESEPESAVAPEATAEPAVEAEAAAIPEVVPEAGAAAESEVVAEAEPEPDAEAEPEVEAEPTPEPEAEAEPEPAAEEQEGEENESEGEFVTFVAQAVPDPDDRPEAEAEPEPEAAVATEEPDAAQAEAEAEEPTDESEGDFVTCIAPAVKLPTGDTTPEEAAGPEEESETTTSQSGEDGLATEEA
jgi:large subunit ribosomal protein L10